MENDLKELDLKKKKRQRRLRILLQVSNKKQVSLTSRAVVGMERRNWN